MIEIKLGQTILNEDSMPYIIAEIGVNHEGDLKTAKTLISLAKEGGAHAVKFQTYKANKIVSKDSPSYWNLDMEPIKNQFDLFKKHDSFNDSDYLECYEYASEIGIDFLSTPFDSEAVDFLDPLVSFHKISSADLTNIPMLRQIASKGKPVLLSTGASTLVEIDIAVNELSQNGCKDIVLLHCILNYPTDYENANLNMMESLQKMYPSLAIGLSDHTLADPDMLTLTAAYLKGAVVIEKHFTHDKTIKGSDHRHSMDVDDLKKLTNNLLFVHKALGSKIKKPLASEQVSRENARRSIVISKDIKKGELISEDSLTYKRPESGISTLYWDKVIGMKAARDLCVDDILQWADLL
jgi:sialic acid synthase SpsE